MRTIGKRWPRNAPRGDVQEMCDYCGVQWRRSQLRKDGAGLWVCPDEKDGLDKVTLSMLNAKDAAESEKPANREPGGRTATTNVSTAGVIDTSVYVQRTTGDDI